MERLTAAALIEVIGELFSDETSIAVSNTQEYVYYRPSKRIDLKINPGDKVKVGTLTFKAMMNQQKISEFINREIFGVPYYGMAVPFFHDGKVEGCVTAIFPALNDGKSFVTVRIHDGWVPIPFSQVIYLEAKDRKTHVFSETNSGTHKYSLQEFEYFLPKESFIRCHRSFIVNVNHIKEIYPDTHSTFILKMKNGDRIPVSQSYSSYFRKLLVF
jgi:hypothetical protein